MTDTGESSAPPAEPLALVLEPYMRKMFEWRVERCSRLVSATEGNEAMKNYLRKSPLFRFMGRTWYIHLYPNLPPAIHLYLFLMEGSPPTRLGHSFGIRTVLGDIEWKMRRVTYFGSAGERKVSQMIAKTFISKVDLANRIFELAKDDVLTIVCSLISEECLKFHEGFVCKSEESIPRHLLPESRFWDLTFNVRNRTLVANWEFLRLRCPYLASVVAPGNTYNVDYDQRAYRQFLLYLYVGRVVLMQLEECFQLYGLANSHQVVALRERCLCVMTTLMDPDNVLTLLDFAEKTSETDLEAVVYKFLLEHAIPVLSSPRWMQLIKENPHKVNQIYLLMGKTYTGAVRSANISRVPSYVFTGFVPFNSITYEGCNLYYMQFQ